MLVTSFKLIAEEKAEVTISEYRIAPFNLYLGDKFIEAGEGYEHVEAKTVYGHNDVLRYKVMFDDWFKKEHNKNRTA